MCLEGGFSIFEGVGGSGPSGAGGLNSLGVQTASFTTGSTSAFYVNFDTPISFVADASSTTIGIHFTSTADLDYKVRSGVGLQRYNVSNGNLVGGTTNPVVRFAVAGTVVPEPSTALLGALGALALLRRRR